MKQINYKHKYQEFISSLSTNTAIYKQAKLYSVIGEYDYTNCDVDLIKKVVKKCNPRAAKGITIIKNVIINFGTFIEDENLVLMARKVNRKELWDDIKSKAPDKFISHKQFNDILYLIEREETLLNNCYYKSLFWCIYEGIYSNNLNAIKNLRGQDINKNTAIIRNENEDNYIITIPTMLANDLIELSEEDTWYRKNRAGIAKIFIKGDYNDSCFKIEQRNKVIYYNSYLNKLRKVANLYLERNLSPKELYISGIMYRIRLRAEDKGYTLQEIFKSQNRVPLFAKIISDELKYSHYNIPINNFREMVGGHLEVFEK